MRVRLSSEAGFGLVELVMAIVLLNVGVLAVLAAFDAGALAIARASKVSTATAVANAHLERYRAIRYTAIGLDPATVPAGAPYTTDTAYGALVTQACSAPEPAACDASADVTGPDGKPYRLDTYIAMWTPPSGRPVKRVAVVVRDGTALAKSLVRVETTFDASTG